MLYSMIAICVHVAANVGQTTHEFQVRMAFGQCNQPESGRNVNILIWVNTKIHHKLHETYTEEEIQFITRVFKRTTFLLQLRTIKGIFKMNSAKLCNSV